MTDLTTEKKPISIWWFAFGYFAAYVPYSFLTKVLTNGLLEEKGLDKAAHTVGSFEILPPTIMASIVVMIVFISSVGWWKYATQWKLGSLSLPRPRPMTLLSGICTGLVVVTTTLAYTIDGVSIVFAMLLMRGGLLIMSPIVDKVNGRHVRWFSWSALALAVLALIVSNLWPYMTGAATADDNSQLFNAMLMLDIGVYLMAYYFRLSFMSKLAKSSNADDTKKFFVEEQMIGTPSILVILFVLTFFYQGPEVHPATSFIGGIYEGFYNFGSHPTLIIGLALLIGLFSQFNGVFGGLVLLDNSENAFAVPVNRCSSILAGVTATVLLSLVFDNYNIKNNGEFVGAAFIVSAILFLTIPPQIAKYKAKKLAELKVAIEEKNCEKAEQIIDELEESETAES